MLCFLDLMSDIPHLRGSATAYCMRLHGAIHWNGKDTGHIIRKFLIHPGFHPAGLVHSPFYPSLKIIDVTDLKTHDIHNYHQIWWRRGELNPCPKAFYQQFLRV
jgi:hypothetical protein